MASWQRDLDVIGMLFVIDSLKYFLGFRCTLLCLHRWVAAV